MYVYVCNRHVCMVVCAVKDRRHVKCLPVLFSILVFETGSLAEPGAHLMAGCL